MNIENTRIYNLSSEDVEKAILAYLTDTENLDPTQQVDVSGTFFVADGGFPEMVVTNRTVKA
jgi:hypothetical protein